MSGRLRILDTGLRDARWNVAASAALLRSVDEGGCNTLRLHRYPMSCVIGRNQDAETELDLASCRAGSIAIARRVTGGGAVVMGPGILAFDLALRTQSRDIQRLARRAGEALTAALAGLGLPAVLATPGSIEIGGRKVSGSAGRLGRDAALHQATLILDLAQAAPLSLLRRRTEAGRPTSDPAHRVTSVGHELASRSSQSRGAIDASRSKRGHHPPVEGEGWSRHLALAFAEAFGLVPEPDELAAAELSLAQDILAREIGRDDYVLENARSFAMEEAA